MIAETDGKLELFTVIWCNQGEKRDWCHLSTLSVPKWPVVPNNMLSLLPCEVVMLRPKKWIAKSMLMLDVEIVFLFFNS